MAYYAKQGYICFSWNVDIVDWLPLGVFLLEVNTMAICKYREELWQMKLNQLRILTLMK